MKKCFAVFAVLRHTLSSSFVIVPGSFFSSLFFPDGFRAVPYTNPTRPYPRCATPRASLFFALYPMTPRRLVSALACSALFAISRLVSPKPSSNTRAKKRTKNTTSTYRLRALALCPALCPVMFTDDRINKKEAAGVFFCFFLFFPFVSAKTREKCMRNAFRDSSVLSPFVSPNTFARF